jgi:A/G-specific adenine glycosylase
LIALKGVGDYTASCIASICFGLPHAAVDGNVFRVLARYYADDTPINSSKGKKKFKELAKELLDETRPGDFNEAMMDLGATVCVPRTPQCGTCPVAEDCAGRKTGNPQAFPVAGRIKNRQVRYFNYLVLKDKETILLQKRTGRDIWTGLYELPLVEGDMRAFALVAEFNERYGTRVEDIREITRFKHPLSHQDLDIRFYVPTEGASNQISDTPELIRPCIRELDEYPFPRPIARFFDEDRAAGNLLF